MLLVTTQVVSIARFPGSGYAAEKEIADSGQLSMARATSAMSSGPGSGTRTCPRPSSLTSNSFELISEQRPWPWQWLASMNSDKGAAPLTGSECMHFYMNLSLRQPRTLVLSHLALHRALA